MSADDNVTTQREMRLIAVAAAAQTAVDCFRDLYPAVTSDAMRKCVRDLERELDMLDATMPAAAGR